MEILCRFVYMNCDPGAVGSCYPVIKEAAGGQGGSGARTMGGQQRGWAPSELNIHHRPLFIR